MKGVRRTIRTTSQEDLTVRRDLPGRFRRVSVRDNLNDEGVLSLLTLTSPAVVQNPDISWAKLQRQRKVILLVRLCCSPAKKEVRFPFSFLRNALASSADAI